MKGDKSAKSEKRQLKKGRRMTGSDVNSGGMRRQQKRKSEWGGDGWEVIVMIVKTSDDSLCPLCRDCSLINLAAEIRLFSAGENENSLPLSSSSTSSTDVGEMK